MKKLLIADGSNIMFRSFYGIRPFTTKSGLHTNAVYGTVTTLSHFIDELSPDAAAVAFDLPSPTFRHIRYAEYKGTRQRAPAELTEQIPYVKSACESLGVKVIELEGYEADDIIGTLSRTAEAEEYEVYILTGDRDSLQLITDKTRVCFITNKGNILYDRALFNENYGAEPPILVDIKALMGDSSDNIPGVPGIGEKTALKLISEAHTLDGIYENIDTISVSNSVREKLLAGRDSAYLSAELAKICTGAPVAETVRDLEYRGHDRDMMKKLFAELEFFKLSERFGLDGRDAASLAATSSPALPETQELTPAFVAAMSSPAVYIDGTTLYVRTRDGIFSSPYDSDVSREFFASHHVICHDFKSLYKLLSRIGIKAKCDFDTFTAAYVLRSGDSSYAPEKLAMVYLNENISPASGAEYAALIYELASALKTEFDKIDSEAAASGERLPSSLLRDIEIPLSPVLSDMEEIGFRIDVDGLCKFSRELEAAETQLANQIYALAGHEFNINSPKQLGTVLFEELSLPAGKKTKTGYSTDADTLEKLRDSYEIVDDILTYRQIAKLRSTYGEGLASMADENGRIHTSFNQAVTATGRLSSAEPNLQNIPIRTELGRELRRFFVPKNDGYVLVDADYSQIELRLLANISGDETMSGSFLRGADIHASTASEVFGVPEEQVTKSLRSRAKAVNFGIVYGIGDYSLARDIGTSRKTAAEYISNYLSTYRGVDAYLKRTVSEAHERGYVTTMLGRRRYIPEISATNKMTRAFGERVAMNSPIQGTAADIIKLAMINTHRSLSEKFPDAHLILQVHDELIIECRREDADGISELLRREMEGALPLPVPLAVEITVADNWYDCK